MNKYKIIIIDNYSEDGVKVINTDKYDIKYEKTENNIMVERSNSNNIHKTTSALKSMFNDGFWDDEVVKKK